MPTYLQYLTYIGVQKFGSEILVANEYPNLRLTCEPQNATDAEPCRYPTGNAYLELNFPHAVADLHLNYICIAIYCVGFFLAAMIIFSLRSYFKRR